MKGEISLQMPNAGPDSESEDHDDRDEVADHINERLTRSLMDCRVFRLFTESTRAQQLNAKKHIVNLNLTKSKQFFTGTEPFKAQRGDECSATNLVIERSCCVNI